MQKELTLPTLAYQPRFPDHYTPGIGIIGCGGIVQNAHLPTYIQYGLNIIGVYDIAPEAARKVHEKFGVSVFGSVEELLADPRIEVVDIATHVAHRAPLIRQAIAAGKHVLSQKPFATDMLTAIELTEVAERQGVRLAVNQNGRWSPAWRGATLLLQEGFIGQVLAVTHMFEHDCSWITGTVFDTIPHWAIYDYAIHWIDITRCWLADNQLLGTRAREYRTPNQPDESVQPWGCWMEYSYANGAHAMLRGLNYTPTSRAGHPFWIHGTEGTIRGSTLGNDFLEVERDGAFGSYELDGKWKPQGFAGSMGELLCAIAEEREPFNSARNNLLTLQRTFDACQSLVKDGLFVALEEQKELI